MSSFLFPFTAVLLLVLCSGLAFKVGSQAGRERGLSEAYGLYVAPSRLPDRTPAKEKPHNDSARIAIFSTLFAIGSSAFLFIIPSQPIDRSLQGEFRRWQGNAYVIVVKYPLRQLREAKLYEDDKLLGPPNSDPQEICATGGGLYRLYKEVDELAPILMFSSSDNTDPNTNGRKYRIE